MTRSFLTLAGAEQAAKRSDGYDIIDHVVERRDGFSRTLFWRGRRDERTWWAVRDGDAKYVRKADGEEAEEWLFDLARHIGEENNLLANNQAEVDRLKELLRAWETEVKPQR